MQIDSCLQPGSPKYSTFYYATSISLSDHSKLGIVRILSTSRTPSFISPPRRVHSAVPTSIHGPLEAPSALALSAPLCPWKARVSVAGAWG
jgi:hypothetical protein